MFATGAASCQLGFGDLTGFRKFDFNDGIKTLGHFEKMLPPLQRSLEFRQCESSLGQVIPLMNVLVVYLYT
jgi:hypothetical protein